MAKRMTVTLVATMMIVAALGFVKFRQVQTAIGQAAAFQPPPEAVTTIEAAEEEWPATLAAIGTVAAVQGVTVSADLPGTVERISLQSGSWVREGEVLALLDTRQERAQLAAAEAQRELTRVSLERMQGLLDENVVSRAEFDRATADARQSDARAGEIRATIERKTVRAPFAGVLGIRRANLGQYLSAGDPLVTLWHQDADLKFTNITNKAGLAHKGWGMGAHVGASDVGRCGGRRRPRGHRASRGQDQQPPVGAQCSLRHLHSLLGPHVSANGPTARSVAALSRRRRYNPPVHGPPRAPAGDATPPATNSRRIRRFPPPDLRELAPRPHGGDIRPG
jgi:biotin carboxyl carrier protein